MTSSPVSPLPVEMVFQSGASAIPALYVTLAVNVALAGMSGVIVMVLDAQVMVLGNLPGCVCHDPSRLVRISASPTPSIAMDDAGSSAVPAPDLIVQRPVVDVVRNTATVEGAIAFEHAVHVSRPVVVAVFLPSSLCCIQGRPSQFGRVVVDTVIIVPLRAIVRRRRDVGHVVALAEAAEVPPALTIGAFSVSAPKSVSSLQLSSVVTVPPASLTSAVCVTHRRSSTAIPPGSPRASNTRPENSPSPCSSAKL